MTRFKLLSGHGFNRAELVSPRRRLQPLRDKDAPQGLKPETTHQCRFASGLP